MISDWIFAAKITVHCLIGCVIGEVIGLIIGVSIGLDPIYTMILATILAFIIGMLLAIRAVIQTHKTNFRNAAQTVWLGEVVSIAVMEIAMNATDYWVGGVGASSIFEPIFWIGILLAIPAGFIAALPVNFWLIRKHLKKCH
jgi:predicted Abi (CAAX) family protease